MKKSSNAHHKHVKGSLCLIPPLLLAVLFYLQFQTLGFFSSIFTCGAGQSSAAAGDYVDRLRASATFLPLKDTREWAEAWFISNVGDTSEPEGEAKNIYFPSPVTDGRLLCLSAPSRRDGTKNAYALAWSDALPDGAELRPGLAYVSETAYDHSNLWHGISALIPFASWHARGVCEGRARATTPARWALFHHGEVRLGMSPWLTSLAEATTGVDMVVETFNASYTPVCFEEAVVFRRNMAGMTRERLLAAFDFMRCKARVQCGVVDGGDPSAVKVTILFRTGARAFKDEAAVTRVFQNECARVAGCKLTTARSDNLTFCDQVRLMSGTDVLISSHGAQMTNLVFMERNSSIMEFYPKGWRERAGGGQFVYRWGADRAGMRHEGSWWDPNGEPCPGSPDILSCYKNRQISHDEAYFAQWAAKVFAANKERKAGLAAGVAASTQRREATTTCQCS